MAYVKKGSGGLGQSGKRSYSLRTQFNYYKKRMEKRFDDESILNTAIGLSYSRGDKIAWKTDFDKVLKEGITKFDKETGKILRLSGEDALKYQIEAMRLRASKTHQYQQFLNNYEKSLISTDVSPKEIKEIMKQFKGMSIDKVTVALRTGGIKQIAFIYAKRGRNVAKEVTDWSKGHKERLNSNYKEVMTKVKQQKEFNAYIKKKYG